MRRSRKPLCRANGTGGSNPPLSAQLQGFLHEKTRFAGPGLWVERLTWHHSGTIGEDLSLKTYRRQEMDPGRPGYTHRHVGLRS